LNQDRDNLPLSQGWERGPGGEGTPDDARLSRDDLIHLVAQLRSIIAAQKETIARQGEAIAALQARSAPIGTAAAPAASDEQPGWQRIALEPGFDYTIVFDGGADPNPGRGYGSYQIVGATAVVAQERHDYGNNLTNNQAEYLTLIRALETLRDHLGPTASQAAVAIRGDSQLVILTVTGRWKVKHPRLQPLHARAVELLRAFGRTDVAWHPRGLSVAALGH
jgi:ribonuclease HI